MLSVVKGKNNPKGGTGGPSQMHATAREERNTVQARRERPIKAVDHALPGTKKGKWGKWKKRGEFQGRKEGRREGIKMGDNWKGCNRDKPQERSSTVSLRLGDPRVIGETSDEWNWLLELRTRSLLEGESA